MTELTVLFLAEQDDGEPRWLRLCDGNVIARGAGMPEVEPDASVVAIAPAAAVALHWARLPDRSEAQALAAARLTVAESSAAPAAGLHIAIGRDGDRVDRPIATVATRRMQQWLDHLAAHGLDPQAIIPAALIVPAPESGFVRADLGGEALIRGADVAFADDAAITPLIVGDAAVQTLDRDAIEQAIARAVASPPLDLRRGEFAHRKRRAPIDWAGMRQLGRLAAVLLLISLSIGVVRLVRLDIAASAMEARADLLARQGLRPGETVNDADRQLDARLRGLRGPGLGFTRTAGAVLSAVRAVPESEATAISFDDRGVVRLNVATQGEGAANDVKRHIEGMGFTVTQTGNFTSDGSRISGEFVVTPR